MEWKQLKKQGFISINDNYYSLTHLQETQYTYRLAATQQYTEMQFRALIQYSSHCISFGSKQNQSLSFTDKNKDKRIIDDRGNERCFCEDRYQLSMLLPNVFKTILDRVCFFTGHENWLTIEFVDKNGKKGEYEIFFRLYKETKGFLRVYVESAYVRDDHNLSNKPIHIKRRDKIKGVTLFSKKIRGNKD